MRWAATGRHTGPMPSTVLYRPVGQKEFDLIAESGWRRFPPRLDWQPIFYPVLNEAYATTIARDWNTKDKANGSVGYVLRFEVDNDYLGELRRPAGRRYRAPGVLDPRRTARRVQRRHRRPDRGRLRNGETSQKRTSERKRARPSREAGLAPDPRPVSVACAAARTDQVAHALVANAGVSRRACSRARDITFSLIPHCSTEVCSCRELYEHRRRDPRRSCTAGRSAALGRCRTGCRPRRVVTMSSLPARLLSVCWAGEGSLGDVREVLVQSDARPQVVVAKRLSPGAKALLTSAGVGWVDETGAAEIAVGYVVVARDGRPPPRPERPPKWTPATLAVAEAVLFGIPATVSATAEATGLSTGSCVNALAALTALGLLEASSRRGRGASRRVADPDRLLAAYAQAAAAMPAKHELAVGILWPGQDAVAGLTEIGRQWDQQGRAWASTGAVAAAVLAPYLTTVTTAEVYVAAESIAGLEAAAGDVGLRPIEGGRLVLRPFPTTATRRLATEHDGLRIVPWPRAYVDLQHVGVRGEEAAEHLRDVLGA